MEVFTLQKEMIRTQTKLQDLVEKHKDLNIGYVNNKLEDYDELL